MWRRRRSVQAEIPLGKEEPAFDAVSNRYLASPGSKQLFQRAAAIKARANVLGIDRESRLHIICEKALQSRMPLEYL